MPQLAPVKEGGIETLEADTFTLQCLQTRTGSECRYRAGAPSSPQGVHRPSLRATGLKFFVTAKPNTPHLDVFLKQVYAHYSDYVLKVRAVVAVAVGFRGASNASAPHMNASAPH